MLDILKSITWIPVRNILKWITLTPGSTHLDMLKWIMWVPWIWVFLFLYLVHWSKVEYIGQIYEGSINYEPQFICGIYGVKIWRCTVFNLWTSGYQPLYVTVSQDAMAFLIYACCTEHHMDVLDHMHGMAWYCCIWLMLVHSLIPLWYIFLPWFLSNLGYSLGFYLYSNCNCLV